jgi:hypothetical protein
MNELPSIDDAVMETDSRHSHDSRMNVKFTRRAVKNEPASVEAGYPVFDERDYVTIQIPGDATSSYDAVVTREHQSRWPAKWAAYKAGTDQSLVGTSLEKLPGMSVSLIATFGSIGVHTVEQLADLSDGNTNGILGINELRRKAKAYLQIAKGDAVKENTSDIAALQKQVAELTSQLGAQAGTKVDVKQTAKLTVDQGGAQAARDTAGV